MSQPQGEERRVVPFAAPPGRERRTVVDESRARGAILLFTGVRYERIGQTGSPGALKGTPAPTPDPRPGL